VILEINHSERITAGNKEGVVIGVNNSHPDLRVVRALHIPTRARRVNINIIKNVVRAVVAGIMLVASSSSRRAAARSWGSTAAAKCSIGGICSLPACTPKIHWVGTYDSLARFPSSKSTATPPNKISCTKNS
jgi:hypothetical protein